MKRKLLPMPSEEDSRNVKIETTSDGLTEGGILWRGKGGGNIGSTFLRLAACLCSLRSVQGDVYLLFRQPFRLFSPRIV